MKFVDATYSDIGDPKKFYSFDDLLLLPKYTDIKSRNDTAINLSTNLANGLRMRIPIISANMDTVTEADMAIAMGKNGAFGILHRFYKDQAKFLADVDKVLNQIGGVGISVGAAKEETSIVESVLKLASGKPVVVRIDTANGHNKNCIDQTRRMKEIFGDAIKVLSGNVVTPDGVIALIRAGADGIHVGIGPGSLCTTREVTGHGCPQATAILNARRAINSEKKNVTLIADGGIKNSGDIVKALALGADSVMIGRLFAATQESPGDCYYETSPNYWDTTDQNNKKACKKYRGQSSADFMESIGKTNVAPEGEDQYLPYQGSVIPILQNLIGGIRSGMSYAGVYNLQQLNEYATFIEVSRAAHIEGTPHGLMW